MLKALWKRVERSYEGEMKFDSAPMLGPYFERHWTSEVARVLTRFYLDNWKFLWGTAVLIALGALRILYR